MSRPQIVTAVILVSGAAAVAAYLSSEVAGTIVGVLAAVAVGLGSLLATALPASVPIGESEGRARTAVDVALGLLLAAITLYLSFNAGGYFPGTTASVTVVIAILLTLRIALAREPLAGFGPWLAVAGGALALLAGWQLLSATWSHALGRAFVEADRTLLYLLTLLFFGSFAGRSERARWLLRALTLAILITCAVALATRLAPDRFQVPPNLAVSRLSYPLTYWNTLGLLAAIGLVLCAQLSTSVRQAVPARLVGAAGAPALAVTLLFTFSRGAIIALPVGLVVYLIVGRPRGVLGILPPAVAAAVAVKAGFDADLLASQNPTSAAAAAQGHAVATILALATVGSVLGRLMLVPLDRPLARLHLPEVRRRFLHGAAVSAALVSLLVLAVALDLPSTLERQYRGFAGQGQVGRAEDQRTRLTDPGGNGRVPAWKLSLRYYRDDRVMGQGAGTFSLLWEHGRPASYVFHDAHSLYVEVLAELGIVGLALLLVVLGAVVTRLAALARRRDRTLYAAFFAAVLLWALRAGADWDWEMPAGTLWVFAVGGIAAAGRTGRQWLLATSWLARLGLGLVILGVGLFSARLAAENAHLYEAEQALAAGRYREALVSAREASMAIRSAAEPYELRGYCHLALGRPRLALSEMQAAVARDPEYWRYRYGVAISEARIGENPRPAAQRALRLNPREPLAQSLVRRFEATRPKVWPLTARQAPRPLDPQL